MYRKDPKQDLRRMRLLEHFDASALDDGEHVVRLPLLRSRQDRVLAISLVGLGLGGIVLGSALTLPVCIVAVVSGLGAFFVPRVVRLYRFAEDPPGTCHVTRDTGRLWLAAFAAFVVTALVFGRCVVA